MFATEDFLKTLNEKRRKENASIPDIDISCPNCQKKAAFFAKQLISFYPLRLSKKGKVSCFNCGLNRSFNFTSKDYYQFEIGKRFFYARTKKDLLFLKDYFLENRRMSEGPDHDFSKLFYKHRLEILKKINRIVEPQKSARTKP